MTEKAIKKAIKKKEALKSFFEKDKLEAGVDESGIGSAFSRLYTAAVIWDPNLTVEVDSRVSLIDDSKKISSKRRYEIVEFIKEYAIDYSIAYVEHDIIDEINVHQANMSCIHSALDNLTIAPELIIVDGNRFKPYYDSKNKLISHTTIIGGDAKYISIAAASILAKTSRDTYVEHMCDKHPKLDERYGIRSNKGYLGSKKHREALKLYGPSKWHRRSYKGCQ